MDFSGAAAVISKSSVGHPSISRVTNGQKKFPKLIECAHFHYEAVEFLHINVQILDTDFISRPPSPPMWIEDKENASPFDSNLSCTSLNESNNWMRCWWFTIQVKVSSGIPWIIRRSLRHLCKLDQQLHMCCFDRGYSLLSSPTSAHLKQEKQHISEFLNAYMNRLSILFGNLVSCASVLNWFELDNHGNRVFGTSEDSPINMPAIAAAYAVRRYEAQAADEISLELGNIVSVIDMPPAYESTWWTGKHEFEVGLFPSACVQLFGDKLPRVSERDVTLLTKQPKPVWHKNEKLIAMFRTFFMTRPQRKELKQRGIIKERVFGCDLAEHLTNTCTDVPVILSVCSDSIEKFGCVSGIYRIPGKASKIQNLRNYFDAEKVPNLEDYQQSEGAHCLASLLKLYFRELPNPLFTFQLYDSFLSVATLTSSSEKIERMKELVQQLPPPHYRTLEALMQHLHRMVMHSDKTEMNSRNLAIVWAPNLLRSKNETIDSELVDMRYLPIIIEHMICYLGSIFVLSYDGARQNFTRRSRSLALSVPHHLLTLEEARFRVYSAEDCLDSALSLNSQNSSDPNVGHSTVCDENSPFGEEDLKPRKKASKWKSVIPCTKSRSPSEGTGSDHVARRKPRLEK